MNLSGLMFAKVLAVTLTGVFTGAVAAPTDGRAQRSALSGRAADVSTDIILPGAGTIVYAPRVRARVVTPAASRQAFSPTVIATEGSQPSPVFTPDAAPLPAAGVSSILGVRTEGTLDQRVIVPTVRRAGRVEKYQSRPAAAPRVTVDRTPMPGGTGTVSLNRFVFRRQPPPAMPPVVPIARDGGPVGSDGSR